MCVTPLEQIDKAIAIALRPGVIFCSFGDMLRVPGSRMSLFDAKARGADVRIVYSPADAVKLAAENPAREVVFFAVGFETTAPANAMAAWQAARLKLPNFSLLVAHVLVPPAMEAVLASSSCRVQAFLAPGHVCTVVGYEDYERVVERHRVPVVITGFEPLDLMEGMLLAVTQLEKGEAKLENQYSRAVRREGNLPAQQVVAEVFEVAHRQWRGIGEIPVERPEAARGVPRVRRRGALRDRRGTRGGAGRVHQRAGAARAEEAARVHGVRHALHAGDAAGGAHGIVGGRVRGLLPLRKTS